MLDHSVILYGSSNSTTHNNHNYPLVLAGGGELGLRHGQFFKFSDKIAMSNLLVTMLNRIGTPCEKFADSHSDITEILKA